MADRVVLVNEGSVAIHYLVQTVLAELVWVGVVTTSVLALDIYALTRERALSLGRDDSAGNLLDIDCLTDKVLQHFVRRVQPCCSLPTALLAPT